MYLRKYGVSTQLKLAKWLNTVLDQSVWKYLFNFELILSFAFLREKGEGPGFSSLHGLSTITVNGYFEQFLVTWTAFPPCIFNIQVMTF